MPYQLKPGARVKGYITGDDDGNMVFRHVYY